MYLVIDPSLDTKIVLYYCRGEGQEWKRRECPEGAHFSVVALVAEVLAGVGCRRDELQGVGVVVGRGRFTAVRVAAVVANTLAYAWRLPVIAIREIEQLRGAVASFCHNEPGTYVLPVYGGVSSAERRFA